jgi:threonyl-tRNA synthetase
MKFLRKTFDFFTNYGEGKMTAKKWLFRMIFLETVAAVPGMVAAMTIHMRSLRKCQSDNGYIHCLLQEAENERIHLMTFLHFRQPGLFMRSSIIITQGIFWLFYYSIIF